jgi:LAO/AO transport system kinase
LNVIITADIFVIACLKTEYKFTAILIFIFFVVLKAKKNIKSITDGLASADFKSLARAITTVENELPGYEELLQRLKVNPAIPVIGVTGPPGAGKSSLVNALLKEFVKEDLKIAIIAVDPSSPFNFGSLMGDRLRMSEYFNSEKIFIRSMAARGSLGGLSAKAIEVTDVLKAASFDYIIVESVGVGQSEVEIAGLADTTIVVLMPESGDEIQTFKAGLMEIADIFVVNKADRPGAETLVSNLKSMLTYRQESHWLPPVIKTVAIKNEGIIELYEQIKSHQKINQNQSVRKNLLLAEKAYQLIRKDRMKNIDRKTLQQEILMEKVKGNFNIYRYIQKYLNESSS